MSPYDNYDEFRRAKLACRECPLWNHHKRVVGSEGNTVDPTVVIVGEAPGADEVRRRRPFVGKTGQVLRRAMRPYGYNKLNTLVTNTIPCRPPQNCYPSDMSVVDECMGRWFWNELDLLKPKYVLLLGAKPLQALFRVEGITKNRGTWFLLQRDGYRSECLPTYHPSYVMRVRNTRGGHQKVSEFLADLREMAMTAGFLPEDAPSATEWHTDEDY